MNDQAPRKRQGSLTRKRQRATRDLLKDNRVCLYTRVSTSDQRLSPEAQLDAAARFAAAKNLEITETFFEAESAYKTKFLNRKSVKRMITTLKKQGIRTILILRLDRAFRSLPDCIATMHALSEEGIRFRMIDHDIDPDSLSGKVFITIMALMAEFQCQIREENQVAAFEVLRKKRIIRNNNPPYGWDREATPTATTKAGKPTYHLVPNPREQKILRQIVEAEQQNQRISHIADRLNQAGIPTKKAGQIINGKTTSGKWHPLTVQRVIEHADLATEEELKAHTLNSVTDPAHQYDL